MTQTASIRSNFAAREVEAFDPRRLNGVRTSRIVGFLFDYALIGVVSFLLSTVLVIFTLGLGWGLVPFVFPVVALAYLAKTLGGPAQATWGMRLAGVRIFTVEGVRVDPFLAMLHGVLFWVLGWWSLPTTFFSSRKRLLHDIVLGTWVGRG